MHLILDVNVVNFVYYGKTQSHTLPQYTFRQGIKHIMLQWTALYPLWITPSPPLPTPKQTRDKAADFEQNFKHPTLGLASQRSFLRKTNQNSIASVMAEWLQR